MFARLKHKLNSPNIAIWMVVISILFFAYSCSHKPKGILILTSDPAQMSGLNIGSFPSIEKIYESDDKIFLISRWGSSAKSGSHELKWEISNKEGERIYTNSYKWTIHPNMYQWHRIFLDKFIKDQIKTDIYTVNLYIDDELVRSQNVQYVPNSIVNRNVQSAVILPFSIKADHLQVSYQKRILNTLANAISFEVKRIIPDTVPYFIAEQSIEKSFKSDCFTDNECLSRIEDAFDAEIFITGDIEKGKYISDYSTLRVYVYNVKTGSIKKFDDTVSGGKIEHEKQFNDLLKGVLYKKGLLDHLRSM